MPACHAGGRGFEPLLGRQYASVAQMVEQETENLRVGGSIPPRGTYSGVDLCAGECGSSSVVECHLAKVDVASPNLVYRSIFPWRHSQAVRQGSAKSSFPGPIPGGASQRDWIVSGLFLFLVVDCMGCRGSIAGRLPCGIVRSLPGRHNGALAVWHGEELAGAA